MDRRGFLKGAVAAGAVVAAARRWPREGGPPALLRAADGPPNILLILVDQMRSPRWYDAVSVAWERQPALDRLREESLSFARHYTAANMCRPARASLLTGLYSHQTGVLLTAATGAEVPPLQPGFPTWGSLLRGLGYRTAWYGKWHLSEGDSLAPYGFAGGTFPSPNGSPGEGERVDAAIADQAIRWLGAEGGEGPWCTTVSFVNPHDIAWYYRATDRIPSQADPPKTFATLPANFETPAELIARRKPRLQRALQEAAALALGPLEFRGEGFEAAWLKLLDLYLALSERVDAQIGRLLEALAARPEVAARTVVIFTADHGEYAGSHGLRGKGGAAYEEAIHVPLYVRDPTGRFVVEPEFERDQLTSSVDLAGLLLGLATGGDAWRERPEHAHLAGRLDMLALLRDRAAAGRPYVLHATDEALLEQAPGTPFAAGAPEHVIALRNTLGKLATYSFWAEGSLDIQAAGRERELYDYATVAGRRELPNALGESGALDVDLTRLLEDEAIPKELRAPLPAALVPSQEAAYQAYLAALAGREHTPTPPPATATPPPGPTPGTTPPGPGQRRVFLPWGKG